MDKLGNIHYLQRSEIDITKWDACIDKAANGLIYGYSFYLDHIAGKWDALVLGDYKAVMPLPWKKKYGIKYIYQPFTTAQLGIFGNITTLEINDFIQKIPGSFKLIELSLNSGNNGVESAMTRKNYVLSLNKPYEILYTAYNENIQRNVKKAYQGGCVARKDIDGEKIISLALAQMKTHSKEATDNAERFKKLYDFLYKKQMTLTYGIFSPKDEILASSIFFLSHERIYYILVGNHPEGKTIGASHALIDSVIKDNAGKKLSLDFEGSDIAGLAQFYKSFGAELESYPFLKLNRLPFYLKWLK